MSDAITQTPKRRRLGYSAIGARASARRSRGRWHVPMGPRTRIPMSTMVTKRTINLGVLGQSSAISSVPVLADFPAYTEFTALFDAYRIKRLTYTFLPARGNTSAADGSAAPQPVVQTITCAIDYNDNTVPTSEAELLEYGSCKQLFMDRPRSISFVPKIQLGATDTITGTVPVLESNPRWLSTDQAKVGHYGLKWFFPQDVIVQTTAIKCYVEAEIEFKMTK